MNRIIKEDISSANFSKAIELIGRFLKKKTGISFFKFPGVEKFYGSSKGVGVRYFSGKSNMSVRFNWASNTMGSYNLKSVSIWLNSKTPFVIVFNRDASLVRTLPVVADIISSGGPKSSVVYTFPNGVPLTESYDTGVGFLTEASSAGVDMSEVFDGVVDMVTSPGFLKGYIWSNFKSPGMKIFDHLTLKYSNLITKTGTKYAWKGTPKDIQALKRDKDKILDEIGCVKGSISRGSAKENYESTGNIDELESQRERLTYEQQLLDMENLLKLTVNGAANAAFIAGRGGIGKTFTVEKVLSNLGLRDGAGYFKNTGSASAAGMYSLLFKYKDKVILFDDSDDALKDQESRNLLKAATDTKKIRKLVWNKMGKNVVDPEDDMTDEEILDAGMIPRYFEFTGKIIFISNLPMNKLDPDGALRTRAFIIDIDPTEMEIYDFMEKICGNIELEDGLSLDLNSRQHIVDLLRKGKSKQSPNLRKLSRGLNMAAGALHAGINVSDADLARMIETYA